MRGGLTSRQAVLKYREIRRKSVPPPGPLRGASGFMRSKSPSAPQSVDQRPPCKHPRVQIVSRDEDAEFVECLECREIFEYSEFKDMSIEERTSDEV